MIFKTHIFILLTALILVTSTNTVAQLALPTAAPVDIYSQVDKKGFGTIYINVKLNLTDEPEGTAGLFEDVDLGRVAFVANGLVYAKAEKQDNRFEVSYTLGKLTGTLPEKSFSNNGNSYNNSFSKTGYFFGYRPAYSGELHKRGNLDVKYAYTLNTLLYTLNGDYSVCANMLSGASGCYGYDESSLGIAFKPTFIIQPTLYIKQKLAITVYFGTAAFLAVDFVNYVGKPINGFDEDEDEVALYPKVPKLIYGYDIAFKGLFSQDDVIRLSSTLSYATSDENEDLSEIVVLYEIPF